MKKIAYMLFCSSAVAFGAASSSSQGGLSAHMHDLFGGITLVDMPSSSTDSIVLKEAVLPEGKLIISTTAVGVCNSYANGEQKGFELATFQTERGGKKRTHALGAVARGPNALMLCTAVISGLAMNLKQDRPRIKKVPTYFSNAIKTVNKRFSESFPAALTPLSQITVMLVYDGTLYVGMSGGRAERSADTSKGTVVPELKVTSSSASGTERFGHGSTSGVPTIMWESKK